MRQHAINLQWNQGMRHTAWSKQPARAHLRVVAGPGQEDSVAERQPRGYQAAHDSVQLSAQLAPLHALQHHL